jgi:sugar/nucleoside kinase (ribokinase family)
MTLLSTGSIGIDTVTTPHGHVADAPGGTAVYCAFAASPYVPVRLVAVAGEDFPDEFRQLLTAREIDLAGLEVRPGSRTFRWTGRFEGDMNEAETLDVKLNVLAERAPEVPAAFADSDVVFLGATHPTLQRDLLARLDAPRVVLCDTKDLWIEQERNSLITTLALVTGAVINDVEARQLTGQTNLIAAGEALLDMGPNFAIVKKGEHGALLVTKDGPFPIPAYPAKVVRDPTGAGDSFAGGLLGFLAETGRHDTETLRRALVHGTVAASFAIEDFSLNRLQRLTRSEVDERVDRFVEMLRFA